MEHNKTISICFSHKGVNDMDKRIRKVFPDATNVVIRGDDCVGCNDPRIWLALPFTTDQLSAELKRIGKRI